MAARVDLIASVDVIASLQRVTRWADGLDDADAFVAEDHVCIFLPSHSVCCISNRSRWEKRSHSRSADLEGPISRRVLSGGSLCEGHIPVPHSPEAVTLIKTLSPVSWSDLMVVLCLGTPLSWPLKTVKEGMLLCVVVGLCGGGFFGGNANVIVNVIVNV